jgi:hypothetical protein
MVGRLVTVGVYGFTPERLLADENRGPNWGLTGRRSCRFRRRGSVPEKLS